MNRKQFLSTGLLALLAGLFLSTGCAFFKKPDNIQKLSQDTTVLVVDAALINNPAIKPKLVDFYNKLTDYIAKGQVAIAGLTALANDVPIPALQSEVVGYAQKDVLAAALGTQAGLKQALGL